MKAISNILKKWEIDLKKGAEKPAIEKCLNESFSNFSTAMALMRKRERKLREDSKNELNLQIQSKQRG